VYTVLRLYCEWAVGKYNTWNASTLTSAHTKIWAISVDNPPHRPGQPKGAGLC